MVLGSGIRKKPISDPGSRGQKGTGSRIRIRNTAEIYRFCLFLMDPDPVSQFITVPPDPEHCNVLRYCTVFPGSKKLLSVCWLVQMWTPKY
jgi:hypothetical protein